MNGKKWIQCFVISTLIITSLLALFNYEIDSLKLVNKKGLVNKNGFIERSTTDLTNNKIIAGLGNYNERFFNRRMFEKFTENKDILVIGASRSLLVRHRNMNKDYTSFYNASVSNAVFGDFLNMIYTYENNLNTLPNNIIISIDPWLFNDGNPENRYLDMMDNFTQMSNKIDENSSVKSNNYLTKYNNIFKIFSLEYLAVNISYLVKAYRSTYKDYYVVDSFDSDITVAVKEPDGSLHYPQKYNNRPLEEITKEATNWLKTDISQFQNFNKISNKKIFENLIQYLLSKNVNITIKLAPFNPVIYNKLIVKYPLITEVESYITQIANPLKVNIIGSYNPYKYSLNIDDFTDYMHAKEEVINNILNEI